MPYQIKNGVVTQVWKSKKTLAQIKKFAGGDIREGDAVVGQIETNGVLTNPPPTPEEPQEKIKRQDIIDTWKAVKDPAAKKLLKLLLEEYTK